MLSRIEEPKKEIKSARWINNCIRGSVHVYAKELSNGKRYVSITTRETGEDPDTDYKGLKTWEEHEPYLNERVEQLCEWLGGVITSRTDLDTRTSEERKNATS